MDVPKTIPTSPRQSRARLKVPGGETGEITLQCATSISFGPLLVSVLNEARANRAIQLFGLFRVFGDLEVGNRTSANRGNSKLEPVVLVSY